MNTSIKAPTVIYQNNEYWCGTGGCGCSYSHEGVALPASAFQSEVDDVITNFTVTDDSYNGKTIDIKCVKNAAEDTLTIATA